MIIIERKKIFDRWGDIPKNIKDVIFSDKINGQIRIIAESLHIKDDRLNDLYYLCLLVFTGFLNRQELYKEIQDTLKIDKKLALELYGELDNKIFLPYKKDIDFLYLSFSIGISKEKAGNVVEMNPKEKLVVLKSDKEQDGVVNLRGKVSENIDEIGQVRPVGIEVKKGYVSNSSPIVEEKASSISSSKTTKSTIGIGRENKVIKAPVILHKKEKFQSVVEESPDVNYKDITMGGLMGSFNASSVKNSSGIKNEIPDATIEIPVKQNDDVLNVNNNRKLNIEKRQFNNVKTVHYSTYKTDLDGNKNIVDGQNISGVNSQDSNGGDESVDLSRI